MFMSKPSATFLRGLCALAFSALIPLSSYATIINGTWDFTAGSYTGSFSFTNFDTTSNYFDSTAAGFTATLDDSLYDTSNVFYYFGGPELSIGGSEIGALGVKIFPDSTDTGLDWRIVIRNLTTAPTLYNALFDVPSSSTPDSSYIEISDGRVQLRQSVPEPETLTLLGLGLAGMGLSRRRKVQVHLI